MYSSLLNAAHVVAPAVDDTAKVLVVEEEEEEEEDWAFAPPKISKARCKRMKYFMPMIVCKAMYLNERGDWIK